MEKAHKHKWGDHCDCENCDLRVCLSCGEEKEFYNKRNNLKDPISIPKANFTKEIIKNHKGYFMRTIKGTNFMIAIPTGVTAFFYPRENHYTIAEAFKEFKHIIDQNTT